MFVCIWDYVQKVIRYISGGKINVIAQILDEYTFFLSAVSRSFAIA